MCVIAYKPTGVGFPTETILKNCYENNPDGAGFMYAWQGKVYIQKGYETYEAFKEALDKVRKKTGDDAPYVMHFRIATQGYEKTMTHPFPLSGKMKNLKKLKTECNIGVAHNGILDITSDGAKDYSDTMKFITDYLSLIIRGYDWYKDDRTKQLIENLIDGSRLAILDKNGNCNLMGKGWVEDENIYYSNSSYSYKKYTSTFNNDYWKRWNDDWFDDGYYWRQSMGNYNKGSNKTPPAADASVQDYSQVGPFADWEDFWNDDTGGYDFTEHYCPYTEEDDDCYCSLCSNKCSCPFLKAVAGDIM